MKIFHRLLEIRKSMGQSQDAFSKKLGLAQSTYANYEKGHRTIPDSVKKGLSQFGINLHWLLTGEGEMFRSGAPSGGNQADDDFRKTFPDVYALYKENQRVKEGKDGNRGCSLCDTVNRLDSRRTTKVEGFALSQLEDQREEKQRLLSQSEEASEPEPEYSPSKLIPPGAIDEVREAFEDTQGLGGAGEARDSGSGYDSPEEDSEEEATIDIPLLGRIAAGPPLDTEAWPDEWRSIVPRRRESPDTHYVLEVSGTSMSEMGILDGSLVLVRRAETAEIGEIVVAYLPDEGVTLKRFNRNRKGRPILQWQDGSGRSQELSEEDLIQGVFVRVVS